MVILIEGPRGAGKSHLVNQFFAQNKDSRFIYYKFEFSNWIERIRLLKMDPCSEVHYFSMSNIITIFDVASSILKDKIIIMDRSLLSAYVWSIYRNRLDSDLLKQELSLVMDHWTYKSSKTIYINRNESISEIHRGSKDVFDEFEDYKKERLVYEEVISDLNLDQESNSFIRFNNNFNLESQLEFNHLLSSLANK
jgi:thymidylate kinase